MPSIKSQRGWIQYAFAVFSLLLGLVTVLLGIDGINQRGFYHLWSWCFLVVGAVAIHSTVEEVTATYTASPSHLEINHLFKRDFVSWEDIDEANALPNFFGQNNLGIRINERRRIFLHTAFLSNTELLNQTIIEYAYLNNSSVNVNGLTRGIYGQPPYGIFDPKADS